MVGHNGRLSDERKQMQEKSIASILVVKLLFQFLLVDLKYFKNSFWAKFSTVKPEAQLGEGKGGGLPCPFLKIKKYPDFGKSCPDCVHP